MKTLQQQAPTPHQTLLNPQNNSPSKFQYSFTRAQRFYASKSTKSKLKTQSSVYHFYDIPSTNDKKAPVFGSGKKGEVFNIKSVAPPATKYSPTLLDDFQHYATKANKKAKGFSFATGRENVKSSSFIQKNTNPGPGNYNPDPEKIMENSFYGFSMTKDSRFEQSRQKAKSALDVIPGPGQYQIKSTLGGHNKILSQDKNINPCPKLMLPSNSSRRIQTEPQRKIYNPLITRTGEYTTFLSKKKGFTMGKSQRSNVIKNKNIPGPGNYKVFSEFINSQK